MYKELEYDSLFPITIVRSIYQAVSSLLQHHLATMMRFLCIVSLLSIMLSVAHTLPLNIPSLDPNPPHPLAPAPLISLATSTTTSRPPTTLFSLTYHPSSHFSSTNMTPQLPPFHPGPWDRAYEAINNTLDRLKLFKRGLSSSAEQRTADHLRPNDLLQRLKDFWRKVTFRRLKVTAAQVEEVKKRYRPVSRMSYAEQRKNGRLGSAFPSRYGQ